jgi:Cu/Ag efflux protein CusF/cytochrome c5
MRTSAAAVLLAAGALTSWVTWPQPVHAHAQATTTVQFDREIVHILDDHCVMCHAEKSLAFPLVTYEQTYAARWQIRMDALNHHMSPWPATLGIGDFANDNSLTQPEIDFLASWAESYGPRNNGAIDPGIAAAVSAPQVVQAHVDFDRWVLGKPDLLLSLAANTISAQDAPGTRRVVIDPKLTHERWLRGLEYKPGDRRVVHAVYFTVQESGQWLGSWTPWRGFVGLPTALAYHLAPGSHIVADIRYEAVSESVIDSGSLGLYFAPAPSARTLVDVVVETAATRTLDTDMHLIAFQPQLTPGLQSVEIAAKMPGGPKLVLLFAKDIPLKWPTPYIFSAPVALPKGSELSVIEHYDRGVPTPARATSVTFSAYAGAALAPRAAHSAQLAPATQLLGTRHFKLAGTVKSVDAADQRVVVQHGDIPGFMGAMTMSYDVEKHEDLRQVAAGDEIQSDVVVSDSGDYLENIKVTRHAK